MSLLRTSARLPTRRRAVSFVLMLLGLLMVVSCTLLGSRELVQCRSNGDCAVSSIANAVCSNGLCTGSSPNVGDGSSDPDSGGPVAPCVSRECGNSSRCVAGRCERLIETFSDPTAAGCFDILPNVPETYWAEDATVIGVYVGVGANVTDQPGVRVLSFALDEINSKSFDRPLVAIVCRKDLAKPKEVIQYLAARGAPLVVGQFEARDIQDISALAREKNIAVWSTLANTKSIQTIDSGGFVRFFLDDIESIGAGFQAALDLAALRVRARDPGAPEPPPNIELAVVIGTDAESKDLATEITETHKLTINGAPLDATAGNGKYLRVQLPAPPSAIPPQTQIVIALAGDEIFSTGGATPLFVRNVETGFGANPRPIWIFGPRPRANMNILTQLFQFGARARVLGVDFSGDRARHSAFVRELTKVRTDVLQYQGASFDALYDALYVAAYAGLHQPGGVAPPRPLTAADFNRHLGAFFPSDLGGSATPGLDVGVAPQIFETGRNLMAGGETVRFQGATGVLEWERTPTNEQGNTRRMGTSMYCMRPQAAGQPPLLVYVDPDTVADAGGGCQQ